MSIKIAKPQTLITVICIVLFSLVAIRPALADDTDIYINQNTSANTAPLLMFSLDWRPNLGNHACNFSGVSSTDYSGIASACGTGWTASFIQNNFTSAQLSKGYISNFELLRAVLNNTMSSLDGINIGLMISHANDCNPNKSGPSVTGCSNGGYIMYGFHYLDSSNSANTTRQDFINKLNSIPIPSGNGAPFQGKELYFELYRYLTGQEVYNGHLGWTDYETDATQNLNVDNPSISWDMSAENTTVDSLGNTVDVLDGNGYPTYKSPITTGMSCSKIYVVNIMFQVSSGEDDSDSAIQDTIANGGMNLNLSGNTSGFDTVVNWMYKNDLADGNHGTAPDVSGDQNVTSYFVTPKVDTTTNGYATAGGTGNAIDLKFDPTSMTAAFKNIFSQVLSVSSTFVSASVPVNVFNRADYLNDVYLALFQAEPTPFWPGNLKKYMLQKDSSGNWFIGDRLGTPAFDPTTGRINFNTLSYWTDKTGKDVLTTYNKNEISGMDGRSVNRGGAGEQIPGFTDGLDESNGKTTSYVADAVGLINGTTGGRTIYTEPTAGLTTGSTLTPLDVDSAGATVSALWPYLNANGDVSSASTGTATPDFSAWAVDNSGNPIPYSSATSAQVTEATNILTWARGIDILNTDTNPDGSLADKNADDSRNWIMGDPIHSTPLTINYGDHGNFTQSNPDVRIVLTGNDGFVHMFQNTNDDSTSTTPATESGKENWAFIPHASLGMLERLMRDGVPANSTTPLHPYGVDGAPVAYVLDGNGDGKIDTAAHSPYPNDQVLLFFGMRRGGRHYYAMDITNPDKPKMLWDINGDCSSCDFSTLGLTFSTPTVATMTYKDSTGNIVPHTVLVFGGGYDPVNKDVRSSNVNTTYDTRGAGIYIVDAETGKLIWKAVYKSSAGYVGQTTDGAYVYGSPNFTDSIPAPVTVLDSDGDGNIDRLYVGDTGGQIWRADLAGTDPSKWTAHVLASVGQRAATGNAKKAIDRRFFHAVDVVQTRNPLTVCSSITTNTACVQSSYAGVAYDAVIVGSGDRANPLDVGLGNATPPDNWFYVFKDYDVVSGTAPVNTNNPVMPYTQSAMTDVTSDCLQTLNCNTSQDLTNGWALNLLQGVGEKVLSRPLTAYGVIYFTTYLPPSVSTSTTSCAPSEGSGLVYAVKLADGTAAYNWDLTNTTTTAAGPQEFGATDRFEATGLGIPANVISIRKDGQNKILIPGKNYLLNQAGQGAFKTFWYTEGE